MKAMCDESISYPPTHTLKRSSETRVEVTGRAG